MIAIILGVGYLLGAFATFTFCAFKSTDNEPDFEHVLGTILWPLAVVLVAPMIWWEHIYNVKKERQAAEAQLVVEREREAAQRRLDQADRADYRGNT